MLLDAAKDVIHAASVESNVVGDPVASICSRNTKESVLDERKPICARCERGGFVCTGYEKVMQFVNTSVKCFSSQSDDSITSSSRRHHDLSRPKSGKVKIADELSLVAFKDEMCLTFVFENFVWRTYGTPWLEQAALGKIGNLASTSCQALAKFNFGKYHHQKDIESDGSVKYGQTLGLLAPQLCRARSQGLETLIVPMLVVLLYAVGRFALHSLLLLLTLV
jgi:hypothetical protein